jgi:hypothetical protein
MHNFPLRHLYKHELYRMARLARWLGTLLLLGSALIFWGWVQFPHDAGGRYIAFLQLSQVLILWLLPYVGQLGFSSEYRYHTHHLLWSWPYSTWQLILAKWLAWSTLAIPLWIYGFFWWWAGHPWYRTDIATVLLSWVQYALIVLWTSALTLWLSSFGKKSWLVPLISQSVIAVLFVLAIWPWGYTYSYAGRSQASSFGVLHSGDIAFWLGGIGIFLWLTHRRIGQLRGDTRSKGWHKLGILVLIMVLMISFPAKYDLSGAGVLRNSAITHQLLKQLKAPLYITLVSDEHSTVPPLWWHTMLRLAHDDGQVFVRRQRVTPAEAKTMGLKIQDDEQYQGIFLEYQEHAAVISQLDTTVLPEYLLSTKIFHLIHGMLPLNLWLDTSDQADLSMVQQALAKTFRVQVWSDGQSLPNTGHIVILGGQSLRASEIAELQQAKARGQAIIWLISAHYNEEQQWNYSPLVQQLWADWGLQSHLPYIWDADGIAYRDEQGQAKSYPLWVNTLSHHPLWSLYRPSYAVPLLPDASWQVLAQSPRTVMLASTLSDNPADMTNIQWGATGPYAMVVQKQAPDAVVMLNSLAAFYDHAPSVSQQVQLLTALAWQWTPGQGLIEVFSKDWQGQQKRPWLLHHDLDLLQRRWWWHVVWFVTILALWWVRRWL